MNHFLIDLIAGGRNPEERLLEVYRVTDRADAKVKIIGALKVVVG